MRYARLRVCRIEGDCDWYICNSDIRFGLGFVGLRKGVAGSALGHLHKGELEREPKYVEC